MMKMKSLNLEHLRDLVDVSTESRLLPKKTGTPTEPKSATKKIPKSKPKKEPVEVKPEGPARAITGSGKIVFGTSKGKESVIPASLDKAPPPAATPDASAEKKELKTSGSNGRFLAFSGEGRTLKGDPKKKT
eukprot:TRINITY_DN12695_c0_g1_i6.p1 TRINITY_DN12695_c0_g1~~TRINITY_DN12695_c0_g1_i6.p1  ORF type:complete len:132 (-),score=0.01 TRINITY_DN12695_c0_g1_i6:109-504(-)